MSTLDHEEQLILERLKFHSQQQICLPPHYASGQLEFEALIDQASRRAVMRIAATLTAERMGTWEKSCVVDVPANWWQHLKQTLFPHRPIKTRRIELRVAFDAFRLFPDADPPHPRLGRVVRYVESKVLEPRG